MLSPFNHSMLTVSVSPPIESAFPASLLDAHTVRHCTWSALETVSVPTTVMLYKKIEITVYFVAALSVYLLRLKV